MTWAPDRTAKLETLWHAGKPVHEIAHILGVNSNKVSAKAKRMLLPKRDAVTKEPRLPRGASPPLVVNLHGARAVRKAARDARTEAVFAVLEQCAILGDRCPENRQGTELFGVENIRPYIADLCQAGRIQIELYTNHFRVVEITAGPSRGKRTMAQPAGATLISLVAEGERRRVKPLVVVQLPSRMAKPAGAKRMVELREGDCRFPLGLMQDRPEFFCGAATGGRVYCAAHARVAYQPSRQRDEIEPVQWVGGQRKVMG